MEEPGGLQSMGSPRVGCDWATSLSLFTFMQWRSKWQPTPVFLPGESQGRWSLVGCCYGVAQSQTRLKRLSSSSSRDLFKKIKRYQGNISCKDGHNKWQKWYAPNKSRSYKEEVAKIHRRTTQKNLNDLDNHNAVITHLEPDILECKVKWALGSITVNKASGGDGIPAELFQILKDDAMKVLHSICQQIWKT